MMRYIRKEIRTYTVRHLIVPRLAIHHHLQLHDGRVVEPALQLPVEIYFLLVRDEIPVQIRFQQHGIHHSPLQITSCQFVSSQCIRTFSIRLCHILPRRLGQCLFLGRVFLHLQKHIILVRQQAVRSYRLIMFPNLFRCRNTVHPVNAMYSCHPFIPFPVNPRFGQYLFDQRVHLFRRNGLSHRPCRKQQPEQHHAQEEAKAGSKVGIGPGNQTGTGTETGSQWRTAPPCRGAGP